MNSTTRLILDDDVMAGRTLYGNDFGDQQLREWYAAEEYGYYDLYRGDAVAAEKIFPYRAVNRADGAALRGMHHDLCLAVGCAEGDDLAALELDIGRIIAIEPAEQCWSNAVAGIPAEFRKPALDGRIDQPDASVDLVIVLNALHHIANVESVVAEFGRILRPGGKMLLREPTYSMGDFRQPRQGMTRYERGIPVKLMRRFIAGAGLNVDRIVYRNTPGLPELAGKLGIIAFNNPHLVRMDRIVSSVSRFNDRYWRARLWQKLAPRWAVYLASK